MLSNESPTNKATCEAYLIAQAQARGQAKALARQMMNFERNPQPMREREAPNPAHGVRIRIIRPVPMVIPVDEECKAHNLAVSELRKP